MKQILVVITCSFFVACGAEKPKKESSVLIDAYVSVIDKLLYTKAGNETIKEFVNYYIVVADTSKSYSTLQGLMYELSNESTFKIDTLNRYYNREKDLICLPENAENKIYRGEYYPRIEPGSTLSLEYLNYYKVKAGQKIIALVAGIYENEFEGNKRLLDVKKAIKTAFLMESTVYVGYRN